LERVEVLAGKLKLELALPESSFFRDRITELTRFITHFAGSKS
jgi:hypothetical protein